LIDCTTSNNIKYNFNKGNYTDLVSSLNIDWNVYFADCIDGIDTIYVEQQI